MSESFTFTLTPSSRSMMFAVVPPQMTTWSKPSVAWRAYSASCSL